MLPFFPPPSCPCILFLFNDLKSFDYRTVATALSPKSNLMFHSNCSYLSHHHRVLQLSILVTTTTVRHPSITSLTPSINRSTPHCSRTHTHFSTMDGHQNLIPSEKQQQQQTGNNKNFSTKTNDE